MVYCETERAGHVHEDMALGTPFLCLAVAAAALNMSGLTFVAQAPFANR
jgi:hypothetical protein